MTYELQRTVDALPVLLPLLGIPVDAVGVVIESKPKPFAKLVPLPGVSSSVRPAQSEAVPEATESGGDETVAVTESASDSGDEGTPTVSRPDAAVSGSVSEEGGDDAAPVASAPAEPVISEATESVSEGESAPAPAVAEPAVSDQGVSPWLLVGVVGALAAGAAGAGVLVGLRRAGRRA